jgi:uncharacterized phage protein gp47/JayE
MPAPFGVTPTGFSAKTLEELLAEIEAEQRANISASLNVSASSPVGQLNGIFASKLRELWELAQASYDSFDPDNATDTALANLALITGTKKNAATKSLATVDVDLDAGVYGAGTLVAHVTGDPTARFSNRDEITSPGGLVVGEIFEAESTGPVAAPGGTLTVIAEPVVGWNSVTNPTDAALGENIESDPSLRQRREDELARVGSSTVDAIRADVLQVEGIESATVFENVTLVVDINGLPGKSFEVIIFDGVVPAADDDEIAQAIWDTKPGGIQSVGSDSGTAVDAAGVSHTINFTRVTVRDVWLEFDIDVNAATYAGDAAVAAAVAAYGDVNLGTGEDVVLAELCVPVFSESGVVDITATRAGFAVSPVGTINLPIGVREIADLDTARILITSTPV